MILVAVIVGYVLGIAPFIYKELLNRADKKTVKEEAKVTENETAEILDEWLNGPKQLEVNGPKLKDQSQLYKEYITGEVEGE